MRRSPERRLARMIVAFAILTLGMTGASGAESSPAGLVCPKSDGFSGPFVPTTQVAEAIYRAVANEILPVALNRYPIITVDDEGDHWSISQTRNEPKREPSPNSVIITAGGGQLHMSIDKCTGAISNVALNR